MKSLLAIGAIVIFLLGANSAFHSFNINIAPEASAYTTPLCAWSSTAVTWKAGANLTATNLSDMKLAVTDINDVGSSLSLSQVTSSENIDVYDWNHPEFSTINGITWTGHTGSTCNSASIAINTPVTSGYTSEHRQLVEAHEMGHAVGLLHATDQHTMMYADDSSYTTYNIFVPVLDDIRALQSSYGTATSTSECWTFTQSGSVTYTGTCSSTNPALPMTDKVTTAGTQNRAFASDTPTGSSLPSSNTVVLTTKVQPSTLYRFSTGAHTNSNVADGASRYATVELDDGGIKAAWSDGLGLTETSTLWSGTPSTSTTYFLELVISNANSEAAYAYKDDGGGSTAPTFLGKASFDTGISSWSGSKYLGTGAWTDSGSNPLSNYSVKEYFNKLK